MSGNVDAGPTAVGALGKGGRLLEFASTDWTIAVMIDEPGADPWTRWYEGYRADRAGIKATDARQKEQKAASNLVACLLIAYMLLGGAIAGITVGLVLAD